MAISSTKPERAGITTIEACALAFGCVIGWGSLVMPGTTFLPEAGPAGTAVALGIAAAVMCVIACCFTYMMGKYPVAGGAYEFTRQVFGRNHAFLCGWLLGLSYLSLIPQNATVLALISRNLMGNVLEFGAHYTVAGYDVYLTEMLFILCVLALFALVTARGVKFGNVLQVIFASCIVLGVAGVVCLAAASPDSSFANMQPAFNPDMPPLAGMAAIITVAPWAFVGFDTLSQSTNEFAFPIRWVGKIMVGAIAAGFLVYVTLTCVSASVVPEGYAGWPEYVADLGSLTGAQSMPLFNAVLQMDGRLGMIALDLCAIGATMTGICGFYRASSRLLYAMAAEGSLPVTFGKLHERYRTPTAAIAFLFVASLLAAALGRTALGWIVDMSSIGAAVGFGYTCAATCKLAREEGRRGLVVAGGIGVAASVVFAILLLIPLFGSSLGMEHFVMLIAWMALGANYFNPRLNDARRKGGKGAKGA